MDTVFRDALRQELDEMRAAGARRQDLSQHACKRLFFDLGVRPSVTLVREFTQTGSASDIPRDIEAFWTQLRSSMRVRIEAGCLPESLQTRAGELLGLLFTEAHQHARTELDAERAEIERNARAAIVQAREAEIRCETVELARQRAEARAEASVARVATLEAQARAQSGHESDAHVMLREVITQLETDRDNLTKRLQQEAELSASLRERVDALQSELRQSTEHYAQQIKDAVKDAERRVKPMLVELDSLRGMASTYQAGVREFGQKEFEYIQQLSAAKSRADRLEAQVRTQSDEIDALVRERDAHRARASLSTDIGELIASLAIDGRISPQELAVLGTRIDAYAAIPVACPACESGEPELELHQDEFELLCPACERTSGPLASKLAAIGAFLDGGKR